jgi:hypothetical protein
MNPMEGYLGDGVYYKDDGWQIKFVCHCMSDPNAIFVDHDSIVRLAEKIKVDRLRLHEISATERGEE